MEVSNFLSQTVRADCFMVSHYVSFCSMAEGCASSSRVTGSGGWTTMGSARSKAESPLSSPREKAFAGGGGNSTTEIRNIWGAVESTVAYEYIWESS